MLGELGELNRVALQVPHQLMVEAVPLHDREDAVPKTRKIVAKRALLEPLGWKLSQVGQQIVSFLLQGHLWLFRRLDLA